MTHRQDAIDLLENHRLSRRTTPVSDSGYEKPNPNAYARVFAAAFAITLVLVAAVGAFIWFGRDEDARSRSGSVELHIGDAAPPFSLPGADGQTYVLGDLVQKKKVLLYFSMGPG